MCSACPGDYEDPDVTNPDPTDQLIETAPRFKDANGFLHWPDRVIEIRHRGSYVAGIMCKACDKHWGEGSYRVGIETYIEVHKDMKCQSSK